MRYLGAGAKGMTPRAVHIYASRITFTSICVVTQSRSKRLRLLSCHLGLSANYCASVSDLSNFTSAIIAHSPNTARLHYLHSLSSSVLHMCIDIGLFIRDSLSLQNGRQNRQIPHRDPAGKLESLSFRSTAFSSPYELLLLFLHHNILHTLVAA